MKVIKNIQFKLVSAYGVEIEGIDGMENQAKYLYIHALSNATSAKGFNSVDKVRAWELSRKMLVNEGELKIEDSEAEMLKKAIDAADFNASLHAQLVGAIEELEA